MSPSATTPPPPSPSALSIPLISLAPLLTPTSLSRLPTAQALLSAFRTSGFLYLTDHSIPPSLLASVFSHSAHFFARPQSQKDALAWTTPESNRGYSGMGMEKVSQGSAEEVASARETDGCDLKESFEIGRDGEVGYPNQWPEGQDASDEGFRTTMRDFFQQCKRLHQIIMSALALALNLPDTFFDPFVAKGDNTLRLLHYPPAPKAHFATGKLRAGLHSDYGSITLLFQDERGGLQVQAPEGKGFVDVKPVAGTIVVNAGDLLARWSNDMVRSTLHRVVEPGAGIGGDDGEEGECYPARYSVAYFCNPDFEAWIEALPGTFGGHLGERRYERVRSGEYLVKRLSATY